MPTPRFLAAAALSLALAVAACSSTPAAPAAPGGRSTSDARVRSFMGAQLPGGEGGQWLRPMAQTAPKVIYYQFTFPG